MLIITWEFGRTEVAVFSLKPIAMESSYDRYQLRDTRELLSRRKLRQKFRGMIYLMSLSKVVADSRLTYTTSRMMAIANRISPTNSPMTLCQTNKQLNGPKFNHVISIQ